MSLFGHIYPGLFSFLFVSIAIHFRTRLLDANFLNVAGFYLLLISISAFVIEAIGGYNTFRNPFFQYAHQVCYLGYFVTALAAFLEARSRLPLHAWRMAFALSFFVEAFVTLGHLQMQRGIEAKMHFILVCNSFLASLTLMLSALIWEGFFFKVFLSQLLFQGSWFFYLGYVVFSGAYGERGEMIMIGDVTATAGLLCILCEVFTAFWFALQHPPMLLVPHYEQVKEAENI